MFFEMVQSGDLRPLEVLDVPCGASLFAGDMSTPIRYVQTDSSRRKQLNRSNFSWTKNKLNVVFESQHESGGHFAAHERPQELARDLRAMFGRGGPAFGVVTGKDGYA
jgi:hypothetical protein